MAGDAVSVAPDHYKVLFENDRVRVLETRYGAGQTSTLHSHPDLVAVALTPGQGPVRHGRWSDRGYGAARRRSGLC